MAVGESFVLINDNRPDPFRRRFEHLIPGCFEWAEVPPQGAFAVCLTRLRPDPAGFDASTVNGCDPLSASSVDAIVAADDGILVRLRLDFQDSPVAKSRGRVLRLAQGLAEGTELLAELQSPDPDLDRALTALGGTFRGAAMRGSSPG